jgi:hypothetical protein
LNSVSEAERYGIVVSIECMSEPENARSCDDLTLLTNGRMHTPASRTVPETPDAPELAR